jgi:hypothetical protein
VLTASRSGLARSPAQRTVPPFQSSIMQCWCRAVVSCAHPLQPWRGAGCGCTQCLSSPSTR